MDSSIIFTGLLFQDEVQSAHWRQRGITIYTIMLYFREQIVSWIVVSDCLQHDKMSVAAFTNDVILYIVSRFPEAKEVSIWTDGPASQYKNRYTFAFLVKLNQMYSQLKFQWNFFATAHGKGPNDALGGRAKRHVAQQILTRKHLVKNAEDFAVAMRNTKIKTTVMTDNDIQETCNALGLPELCAATPAVPGINNTHCITQVENAIHHIFWKFRHAGFHVWYKLIIRQGQQLETQLN